VTRHARQCDIGNFGIDVGRVVGRGGDRAIGQFAIVALHRWRDVGYDGRGANRIAVGVKLRRLRAGTKVGDKRGRRRRIGGGAHGIGVEWRTTGRWLDAGERRAVDKIVVARLSAFHDAADRDDRQNNDEQTATSAAANNVVGILGLEKVGGRSGIG
jgi:hypothetical protein